MSGLPDAAVKHLQWMMDVPDVPSRYAVQEVIGRGGMGAVYRAHDTVLGRDVAIKVTSAVLDAAPDVEQLLREARILATLEHPGIMTVHDAGVSSDGRCWYAMRLVRGAPLHEWAATRGLGDRLRTFLRVCDAIAFAHARGVIHRDIKPTNIMIGDYGDVLVLDWGVARRGVDDGAMQHCVAASGSETSAGRIVGTPGFMAPEQRDGRSALADARTDIYALGVVLRTLFVDRDAPRPLAAAADKASADAPDARYQQVEALADDVRRWLDGQRVLAYRYRWWERLQRVYLQNQAIVLLFVAYIVVRMIILWWRGI